VPAYAAGGGGGGLGGLGGGGFGGLWLPATSGHCDELILAFAVAASMAIHAGAPRYGIKAPKRVVPLR
jgi:hypothetical protein